MATDDRDDDSTRSLGDFENRPDRPRIRMLGHFKIEATLGSGGMGTIYRAYDESMKRPVALKVLHSSLELSSHAQSRFVREAWIAGQLDHPNIVKVYSRGEESNVSYLAMELIEGGSLFDLMKKTRKQVTSDSDITKTTDQNYIKEMLAKFVELANALDHIHSRGFIHRDIKPQNILLSGEERKLKFTDFGIAHAEDMTRMTRAGDFIGTVKYMSPELLAAHRAGIDKRTDIYSLGVTLYETLTLSLPFKADSEEKLIGEILAGHYIAARRSNRRVPVDLETVLMKACHHDPSMRYQTAAEFAADLQQVIDDRPILAKRPGLATRGYKYLRRNYRVVVGIVATCAVMTMVIFWSLSKVEQANRTTALQRQSVHAGKETTFTKIEVPGLGEYCAISPDGEKIAFVAEDKCLWVAPMHGSIDRTIAGQPVRLTEPLVRWAWFSFPVWSADGKWIAFNAGGKRDRDYNTLLSMFVVPSMGGAVKEVPVMRWGSGSERDFRISLSPDGKQLAFLSDSALIPGESMSRCIYTVSVDGGEISRLTDSSCEQPSYSPDGSMMAYVKVTRSQKGSGIPAQSEVYVAPSMGGESIKIAAVPGMAVGPVWSPDSRMIAYGKFSEYTNLRNEYFYEQLCVIRLSEEYQPIGSPDTVDLPYSSIDLLGGWASNNKIAVILNTEERGGCYTVSSSGGVATQVTSSSGYSPRWSPDGGLLYFMDDTAIYSMPAEGGAASMVPITGMKWVNYANCDISPDGKSLSIVGLKKNDSVVTIFTVPVSGGEPVRIVYGTAYSAYSSWSPDGTHIAFGQFEFYPDDDHRELDKLCMIPTNGGEVRILVSTLSGESGKYSTGQMAWSPDGKYIAYPSYYDTSSGGVSIVSVEGSDPELLVQLESGYQALAVAWSPDGSKVAYCEYDTLSNSGGGIWILPLSTKQPYKLRTGLDLEAVWMLSWSPDGERIAFASHWEPQSELYLIENFLPAVTTEETPPPKEPTFSMINVPGLLDYCALSPDGKRIAFASSDGCLWVAPTRGAADSTVAGEAVKLTNPLGGSPLYYLPVWSADGNWIALNGNTIHSSSDHWASMYVIPSNGGEFIELPVKHDFVDRGRFWDLRLGLSPDGSEIAFFSHTSPITGNSVKNGLYAMPVRGGEIRRLADSLCEHSGYCGQPAYSRDGKMLAFVRGGKPCGLIDESSGCDIWIAPVDGGSPWQITDLPGVEFGPIWSPDGRKIAFSQWTETEIVDMCQVKQLSIVSLSNECQPLGSQEVVELPLPSDDFMGGWSADDEIGLVLEIETQAAIYSVPSSGGVATMLRPSIARSPSWSPDGKRVFYVGGNDVYSVSSGGGQESLVPITGMKDIGFESGCDVSPSGDLLALAGIKDGDSLPHIFTVSVTGGLPKQITFGSDNGLNDWSPSWSPDGKWIAFSRYVAENDSIPHLCIVATEGGETLEIVAPTDSAGANPGKAGWSPDRRSLAYSSYHSDSLLGISLVPIDGGDSELLVKAAEGCWPMQVRWSPDGEKLAYSSYKQEHGDVIVNIWIVSIESGEQHVLPITGHYLDAASQPEWSPDGKKIVFKGRQRSKNTLCLIKDLFPER